MSIRTISIWDSRSKVAMASTPPCSHRDLGMSTFRHRPQRHGITGVVIDNRALVPVKGWSSNSTPESQTARRQMTDSIVPLQSLAVHMRPKKALDYGCRQSTVRGPRSCGSSPLSDRRAVHHLAVEVAEPTARSDRGVSPIRSRPPFPSGETRIRWTSRGRSPQCLLGLNRFGTSKRKRYSVNSSKSWERVTAWQGLGGTRYWIDLHVS
jgi:hypothetical protein